MNEKIILAFDFEECKDKDEALERAKVVRLRSGDKKRIFVVKEEIPWPEKEKS